MDGFQWKEWVSRGDDETRGMVGSARRIRSGAGTLCSDVWGVRVLARAPFVKTSPFNNHSTWLLKLNVIRHRAVHTPLHRVLPSLRILSALRSALPHQHKTRSARAVAATRDRPLKHAGFPRLSVRIPGRRRWCCRL